MKCKSIDSLSQKQANMKNRHMTKKQLSKERLRVRREMDEWSLREAGAVLGLRTGACTPEQADFAKAEVKKLNDEMRRLNKPAAKQLRWVGQGFAKK